MISIVVPLFDEAEGVRELCQRLDEASRSWPEPAEFVFVNDGSRDATLALCLEVAREDPRFKVVSFTRNFGHQAAVSAGLCYASGDLVAVMDADLQDPPEELARFLDKCREGYDVVYAIRTKRKEGPLKRLSYWLYYRLIRLMSSIDIPVDAGDFCVMRRNVVDAINGLPERERFIRGLRTWVGSRQTGVAYERRARAFGQPKYTLRKLFALALDGLIGFSMKPLRLLFFAGLAVALFAFLLGGFVLFQYVTNTTVLGYNPHQSRGWTSLILAILFFAGTQLIAIGVLGEYLGRVFDELKRRPTYLVAEQHGFGHEQKLYPGLGPFEPGSHLPTAAR